MEQTKTSGWMRRPVVGALVAASLGAATMMAGGPAHADTSFSLVGTTWILQATTGDPVEEVPVEDAFVKFTADGKVKGKGGCNGFGGSAKVEGGTISLGSLGWTLKACQDSGLGAVDMRMAKVLKGRVSYDIDGDRLRISKHGKSLVLRAQLD